MGGCQTDGPFLGALNTRCRTILGTPEGTIILTTTQMKEHTLNDRETVLHKYDNVKSN